jgi:hypothetical protein
MPAYHLDFARDVSYINGTLSRGIASVAGLSGTLNLGPEGHTIASSANVLSLPISGVTFPHGGIVAFRRTADSGLDEPVAFTATGLLDYSGIQISTADQARAYVIANAVQEASIAASGTSIVNVLVRSAYRVAVNSAQAARSQAGSVVAFGTEDVGVAVPATPDTWYIGSDAAGALLNFRGAIRSASLFAGTVTDAHIAAAAAHFC